jgi:glyoxylate/hydroxypyruvate reductase A
VTPHIAGRTLVPETVAQIAGKIRALEAGLPIEGMVDRSRGY